MKDQEWETFQRDSVRQTERLPVPGGWLYLVQELTHGTSMLCFVQTTSATCLDGKQTVKRKTKSDMIFDMLLRSKGATHKDFQQATGWVKCQQYPKDVALQRGHKVAVRKIGRIAHYKAFKVDDTKGQKEWEERF